jgi:hypothetical protein
MRNSKWDKKVEKAILRLLDGAVRKYGIRDARHAVSKWARTQTDRLAIAKERRRLEQELAEVNARLRA